MTGDTMWGRAAGSVINCCQWYRSIRLGRPVFITADYAFFVVWQSRRVQSVLVQHVEKYLYLVKDECSFSGLILAIIRRLTMGFFGAVGGLILLR